jgi:hypothetical protein
MEATKAEHLKDVTWGSDGPTWVEAGLLLRTFLGPAREAGATPEAQLEAYRLLLTALNGRLGDLGFALAVHTEWIRLSPGALARGARGRAWRPGGEPRSDASGATG